MGFPIANAVWFNDDLVAFPEKGVKSYNIDVYDVRKNIINITGLQQIAPRVLTRGAGVDEVLFLAATREKEPTIASDDPPESIYRLFANTGAVEPAFPWLETSVEDYTYHAGQDLLAYRIEEYDGVIVAEGATGTERRRFPGKTRVSISVDGRFWTLEGLGDPIPVFHQRTEEDQAAGEGTAGEVTIPDYMEREVQPPALWIVDTTTDQEVLLDGVFGSRFQWYVAAPYYASFVLWGMENKEFNRNVVLTNLTPQLKEAGIDISPGELTIPGEPEPAG